MLVAAGRKVRHKRKTSFVSRDPLEAKRGFSEDVVQQSQSHGGPREGQRARKHAAGQRARKHAVGHRGKVVKE